MRWIWQLLRNDEAATAVEYAVLLAMILLAVIGAIGSVGVQSGGMWGYTRAELQRFGF